MIIAIDGTVCSGKSTIAKNLAKRLNFMHLNSGALYRAITLKIINKGMEDATEEEIFNLLQRSVLTMTQNQNGELEVFLDGVNVTSKLRTPEVSQKVSIYSKQKKVREYVTHLQKQIAKQNDIVVEGRDIGTVVFPNAEVKIFMTADLEVRAKRRMKDYLAQGKNFSLVEVMAEIEVRDKTDSEREISPLKPAKDAIIYYNNGSDIEKVLDDLTQIIEKQNSF